MLLPPVIVKESVVLLKPQAKVLADKGVTAMLLLGLSARFRQQSPTRLDPGNRTMLTKRSTSFALPSRV